MFEKYTPFKRIDAPVGQRVIYGETGMYERGLITLPRATWESLNRLCAVQKRTGSQVIEALIALAYSAQGGKR